MGKAKAMFARRRKPCGKYRRTLMGPPASSCSRAEESDVDTYYHVPPYITPGKALVSLERAKEFCFEMKKLLG